MKEDNSKKIILDLCGGTGSWSKPYKDAGYDVRVITLPEYNILETQFAGNIIHFRGEAETMVIETKYVYGILAAPPCTMFSLARTRAKKPRDLQEGMERVRACLAIIWKVQEVKQETRIKKTLLKFWALENPARSLLKNFLGEPPFVFTPWEFGDGYKKDTALWGNFNHPVKTHFGAGDKLKKFDRLKTKEIHPEFYGKLTRQERRAITPAGFAQAFFKANQ